MKRPKIAAIIMLVALAAAAGAYSLAGGALPDVVNIEAGEKFSYRRGLLTLKETREGDSQAASSDMGSYSAKLCLFDLFPLKTVRVNETSRKYLVVGGEAFGVKLLSKGVMAVGFGDVKTATGTRCPAKEAGLELGDVILTVDGKHVTGNEDLAAIVSASRGDALKIVFRRKGENRTASLIPANAADRTGFKAGMWVRDSSAGIGTITYVDAETGVVAGLGHGVADSDTGEIYDVADGELAGVVITGIAKGQSGSPGELKGLFKSAAPLASLSYNCEFGVFGRALTEFWSGREVPVAFRQEVERGAAKLVCTLDASGPKSYDVEIEAVSFTDGPSRKSMVIKVTDPELLEKTGGIVRGMSGSPLIQNGRLIGAVTHVFVGDPTKGYGIFIETMLECGRYVQSDKGY